MLVFFLEVKKKTRSAKKLVKTSEETLSIGMYFIVINILILLVGTQYLKVTILKKNCMFHYINHVILNK